MALEAAAAAFDDDVGPLAYDIRDAPDGTMLLDPAPMIRELVALAPVADAPRVARAFHETVAAMLSDAAVRACERASLDRVVLSGGCFANRLVIQGVWRRLRKVGLAVFIHRAVPAGDGGIALGQAAAAAARMRKG